MSTLCIVAEDHDTEYEYEGSDNEEEEEKPGEPRYVMDRWDRRMLQ